MTSRAAAFWTCPWCERVVPARETRCHCGCDRAVAEAKQASESRVDDGAGLRILLIAALLAAAGFIVFVLLRQRNHDMEAAALAAREGTPPSEAPVVPSRPPPTYGELRTSTFYPPPPVPVTASPSVEPSPVLATPSPQPSEEPSPATSTMEDEWEKASALLGPPLQKIAADSGALEGSYQPFASQCLARDAARGADSWLSALKNAPLVGNTLFLDGGDCPGVRSRLLARANQIKAELSTTEDLARTSRVLPGHWRRLMADHQLELWDQY